MNSGDPWIVWMANKLWEDHGTDQRLTRAMERHARILWVDPPVSMATSAKRRFGAARTVRPVLCNLSDRVTRLTPAALPGMTRQLIHRAARDHIGGIDLIPVLRLIAERVALDPDLVRRLSGRGPLSRPLATAQHGAAKFRQQPMRCRIDGPVEIIIVRR